MHVHFLIYSSAQATMRVTHAHTFAWPLNLIMATCYACDSSLRQGPKGRRAWQCVWRTGTPARASSAS